MDEAMMAKALEGKFFWEGTSKYDPDMSKDCLEIRKAQSKYVPKEVRPSLPPNWSAKPEPVNFKERVEALKEAVSVAFGVQKHEVVTRSRQKEVAAAKSFFIWAMCRYFPETSLAVIGKIVGKHHSTIIHHRDEFSAVEHIYADIIEQMDKYMDYRPG